MTLPTSKPLPLILLGPMMRRCTRDGLVLSLVVSRPLTLRASVYRRGEEPPIATQAVDTSGQRCVRLGEKAFFLLVEVRPTSPLPIGEMLEFDLVFDTEEGERRLADELPHLLYEGESRPGFVLEERLNHLLHGSCRKPHDDVADGLVRVDAYFQDAGDDEARRPALLMMTGDQIYADDVAGPMLSAIHQVIALLGLYPERLTGAVVDDSAALFASPYCYYRRQELLPHTKANEALRDRFFGGARKPIFTADTAHNHLITLAEVVAMYLLVWSPQLWPFVRPRPDLIREVDRDRYREELLPIEAFVAGLPRVQRALAHVPVYMIFDDHDVTDDWNLTRGWEEAAYGHPLSQRIIGNTLIGYWLFQAWGNDPGQFDEAFLSDVRRCFEQPGGPLQDALIDRLLNFENWHFSLPTTPKLIVLDTRTHRWWSESSLSRPSGLMDWESLTELQQALVGESAVVMVSPAPVFGVKLIEAVQRVFSLLGHALLVDAENWMAHPGSANVILNIFRHPKTPRNFVILSGDVHYSFVYDVTLRFRSHSPRIWQITCSGFKNEFPARLLTWFDRLNRWFYASYSPLNWLTKRRHMLIRSRRPTGWGHRRLVNRSGVGRVILDEEGEPVEISLLPADGGEVRFEAREDE